MTEQISTDDVRTTTRVGAKGWPPNQRLAQPPEQKGGALFGDEWDRVSVHNSSMLWTLTDKVSSRIFFVSPARLFIPKNLSARIFSEMKPQIEICASFSDSRLTGFQCRCVGRIQCCTHNPGPRTRIQPWSKFC